VSGRVRCTNGQGQAPNMGANGTNMAFLIVFTLTGRREEFPARDVTSPICIGNESHHYRCLCASASR